MIWKFLKQNVLFPKGLNWVQHWVSRIGLWPKHSWRAVFSSSAKQCLLSVNLKPFLMQTEQQTQERRIVNPRRGRFDTEKSLGAKNSRLEIQRGKQKRWMEMVATNSVAERTSLNEFQMLKFLKSKWKRFWIISLINIRSEHRGNKTRFARRRVCTVSS